mgnify:CR=1 FL=1
MLGKSVFIPDFSVTWRGKTVYVEVIGYWRRSYILNKEIKIRNAIESGIDIIIVVHKDMEKHFRHLPTPMITYSHPTDLPNVAVEVLNMIETI